MSIMSLKDVKNKPHRSAFDLSRKNMFTAKVGELLPVMTCECLPGDKFEVNIASFARTMPVNTAAYTRIKEYYDFFFVPYRLLCRYSDVFFSGVTSWSNAAGSQTSPYKVSPSWSPTIHPWIYANDIKECLNSMVGTVSTDGEYTPKYTNCVGADRMVCACKLLNYLGYGVKNPAVGSSVSNGTTLYSAPRVEYGNLSVQQLNPFPILAYQKIYQDYYRFDQWELANPSTYNVDYLDPQDNSQSTLYSGLKIAVRNFANSKKSLNMFDLRYCNWQKDMFMGMLPSSQYGDVATIDLVSSSVGTDFTNIHINNPLLDFPNTEGTSTINGEATSEGTKIVKDDIAATLLFSEDGGYIIRFD